MFADFFLADTLRQEFRSKLNQIQAKSPTAEDQNKTECCRSGVCCWRRPGDLDILDITKIASFLTITEKELFQNYLIVDKMGNGLNLLPKRAHQSGGEMVDWRETYSIKTPCVFLDIENN